MMRSNSNVVSWDKQVRVRHVLSGRYLAVDTSEPGKISPPTKAGKEQL
jgi:hypothetical protein